MCQQVLRICVLTDIDEERKEHEINGHPAKVCALPRDCVWIVSSILIIPEVHQGLFELFVVGPWRRGDLAQARFACLF